MGPLCRVSVAVFPGPLRLPRDAEAAGGAGPADRVELPPPFFLPSFCAGPERQRRGAVSAAAGRGRQRPRGRASGGGGGERLRAAAPPPRAGSGAAGSAGSSLPSFPAASGTGPGEASLRGRFSPLGSKPLSWGCRRGQCRARRLRPQLGAPRPACAGSRGPCRARIYCALESPSPGLGPGGEGCFPPKSCPDGSWCLSCMRRVNAAGREAAVFLISFLPEHHSSPPDNFICLHLGLFLSFICKLATAEK